MKNKKFYVVEILNQEGKIIKRIMFVKEFTYLNDKRLQVVNQDNSISDIYITEGFMVIINEDNHNYNINDSH